MIARDKYTVWCAYSSHDGGFYAEVVDAATGKTAHTTATYSTRRAASAAAWRWINTQPAGAAP